MTVKSLNTYHSKETLIIYLALYSLSEILDGAVALSLLLIIDIENFPKGIIILIAQSSHILWVIFLNVSQNDHHSLSP